MEKQISYEVRYMDSNGIEWALSPEEEYEIALSIACKLYKKHPEYKTIKIVKVVLSKEVISAVV